MLSARSTGRMFIGLPRRVKPLGKVHSSVSFREKKLCCNAILDAVSGLIRAKSSGCNFPDPSRIQCWLEIDRRLENFLHLRTRGAASDAPPAYVRMWFNIDHPPFSSD